MSFTASYGFWNNKVNQRSFLENIAKRFDIKKPSDWGQITYNDVKNNGGSSILLKNGHSVFKALHFSFPG